MGEREFRLDGARLIRRPGKTDSIPRGEDLSFRIGTAIGCRHLTIIASCGLRTFFADMAAGRFHNFEDLAAMEECAACEGLSAR